MNKEYSEDDVARILGIQRDVLRNLRKNSDIDKNMYGRKNRQITYTQDGIAKIAQILDIKNTKELNLISEGLRGLTGYVKQGAEFVIVTNVFIKNTKFIEANLNEKKVVIRVRNNKNFLTGMEIPVRNLRRSSGSVYDFVGNLPRGRGRW